MTEFKVGDRVRLTEDYGRKEKGYEGVVTKVKETSYTERGVKSTQLVTVDDLFCAFNLRFELVERSWEFEVGKYYRNIRHKDHIVRVNAFTPEVVYFTVVSSLRVKSGDYHLGYKPAKRVWEPYPAPKGVVKKSGWIIVEHRLTLNGSKAIVQCPVFDTEEEAKKWVSDKFHHVKIESVKYYKIEWEEAAKVEDDDMV